MPLLAAFNLANIAATGGKAYSTGMREVAISRNEEMGFAAGERRRD